MDQFARIVIGFHGCTEDFARDLLLGVKPIPSWEPSSSEWDWLGHGIYFWEHGPERAFRWAKEKYAGTADNPAVLGAVVQLGRCFDLLNEAMTSLLKDTYPDLLADFVARGKTMPQNRGKDLKRRDLDCLVINHCLNAFDRRGLKYDTVRGAFLEGEPAYPGAG